MNSRLGWARDLKSVGQGFALVGGALLLAIACTVATPTPTPTATPTLTATPTPSPLASPTATPTVTSTLTPQATATSTPQASAPTVYTEPPDRDLWALAQRLRHASFGSGFQLPTVPPPPQQPGQSSTFWITTSAGPGSRQVNAILAQVSEHAYWYFEEGVGVSDRALEQVVATFEGQILPVVSGALGGVWVSGADGDPRLTVLHVRIPDAAGYYSASDQYPTAVHPFSNQRAIIYLSSQALLVGSRAYLVTLTHELQHAIHWAADPTEETWVNEGLSEFVTTLVGYQPSFVGLFDQARHRTSLTAWPTDLGVSGPSYGAATRFFQYLAQHYGGEQALNSLLRQPQDGIAGIDAYLEELGYAERFEDVFQQWVIANALDMPSGPYSYPEVELFPLVPTATLSGFTAHSDEAPQYAAHYLRLKADAPALLRFEGALWTPLLPTNPPTPFCWWSNRGDAIDSTLTHPLDLRQVDAASLHLTLWYDIEEDWDYAYAEVSADGGVTWDILEGELASVENPVGNAFGPGYTGHSDGWVNDSFDLSPYAGRRILLRLEYVTDDSTFGDGLCLAAASVPEIGFQYQATQPGAWEARGFVFSDNRVPQPYAVQVILLTDSPQVLQLPLSADNTGTLLLPGLGSQYEEALVVIAPMAPQISQPAPYTVRLERAQ